MPYNMIYALTADIGGTRNASNWIDRTNYYEQVPAAYLERMLWTHRERMAHVVIDDEVFETERGVVKEELRQRVLAPPYGRLQRFVLPENAYDVMPHRRPGIGSIAALDSATLDDARAFYEAYYGPGTATLIVAGNFEVATLRGLVDQYFADIPPHTNPVDPAIAKREPTMNGPRMVKATAPNVPLPVVGGIWKAPPVTHDDAAAIAVMEAILGRGNNNRLDNALVRSGQAVEVNVRAQMYREAGHIAIYALLRADAQTAATHSEAQMQVAGRLLEAELARLRSELVTPDELAEARNEIIASALRRRETARGRAFELGEALMASGDPDFADEQLDRIAGVTAQDVLRVARRYLDPQKRITVTYTRGADDPATYANPAPMPAFRTLPRPVGDIRQVKPEAERVAPPGPGPAPEVAAPAMVEATLSNGIRVVAAKTGNVPIATITMVVPGGSKTDPRDKAGVANMAAMLADKGIHGMDATAIAARFESLGARFAGGSGSDSTSFSVSAPTANLAEAGQLAAAIVKGAIYPDDVFERERRRGIDSLAVKARDPGGLARMVIRAAMYGNTPYGTQPDGTEQSLAGLTRSDLLEYRQRYIHPHRMQIVISGGIDPDDAIALAEAMLGDWDTNLLPWPIPEAAAGLAQPVRTIVVDMPEAGQASVMAAVRAPSRKSADFFPLKLANSVLGGGSSGRLFEQTRTRRSLSYGAYSGFAHRADESILTARAQTGSANAAEVVQVFLTEFARLGSEPFGEALLDKRRLYLEGRRARSLETSSGFNRVVGGLMVLDMPAREAFALPDRLAAIQPAQVSEAARRFVDPERTTVVVVGNAELFIDELRQIRSNVEVIPADALDLSSASLRKTDPGRQE